MASERGEFFLGLTDIRLSGRGFTKRVRWKCVYHGTSGPAANGFGCRLEGCGIVGHLAGKNFGDGLGGARHRLHRRLALGDDWGDGCLRERRPGGDPGDDKDGCNDGDAPH